jgi:FkbM family methyltransferase
MIAPVSSPIGRFWRTWLYELLTYVGSERLGRMDQRRIGHAALRTTQDMMGDGWIQVRGGAGFGLRLSTRHLPIAHIQGYGLVRGVLEPSVQEALRRHVRPGMVVYDVGANIGFFSLLAARFSESHGRVEAFEPVPGNSAAVRANAALNHLTNITVHQLAVSDHGGTAAFLVPGEQGWSHLADRGRHPNAEHQIQVELISLDEEIGRGSLPVPDIVKIDVEGSETAVLRGLARTLRSHHVTIICELHETNSEVLNLMTNLGYSLQNLDGTAPIPEAGPIHVLMQPTGYVRPDPLDHSIEGSRP